MKINYSDFLNEVEKDSGLNIEIVKKITTSFIKIAKQHMLNCDEINILNFCKFYAGEAQTTHVYNFQEKQTTTIPNRILPKCEFVRAFKDKFKKEIKKQA